jgi:outer membrane protein OmpA-like peptidoglycan-associated protein
MEAVRAESGLNLNGRFARALCVGMIGVMGTGLVGCETANEHRTATGAIAGTVIGAAAGAMISDDSTKGALIGGAAGALVGGGIGYVLQRQKEKFDEIEGVQANEQTVYVPEVSNPSGQTGAESSSEGEVVAEEVTFTPAQGLTMTLTEQLLFPYDSSALTSQGTSKVAEIADVLKEFPDSDVFVMGYTSSDGDDGYNVQLSQRRADAVRNTLIANQVSSGRITALGMGSSNPVATNDTESGRMQNRRVEIIVVPRETAA